MRLGKLTVSYLWHIRSSLYKLGCTLVVRFFSLKKYWFNTILDRFRPKKSTIDLQWVSFRKQTGYVTKNLRKIIDHEKVGELRYKPCSWSHRLSNDGLTSQNIARCTQLLKRLSKSRLYFMSLSLSIKNLTNSLSLCEICQMSIMMSRFWIS